ncbi:MAG TPA: M50 family metallopeptidase [Candidatus Eremiobacteraceae bacterium]|nr:M50 family metallopeptidase [Candidatus Eremiobacteraceae bacterium]
MTALIALPLALLLAFNPAVIGQVAIFLIILAGLVVFHEFGHFVFAKRFGVTVEEFAVGFGPRIASVTRGGTAYSLNALPLGGYCKMLGEDTADDGSANPGNFQHKPLWQRIVIIFAGPLFNVVLAALIFAFIGTAIGVPKGSTNVIAQLLPGYPAEKAGLQAGDEIVGFNGTPVKSGDDLIDTIHREINKPVTVDIRRDGAIKHFSLVTTSKVQNGKTVGLLGFAPEPAIVRTTVLDGVSWGFTAVAAAVVAQVVGIVGAVSNHDASGITGTVGVARVVIQAEKMGLFYVLYLAGELSVVLALFNLLPIPALDGGRLAFLAVEGVRGRPVDPEKEGLVHLTGFALIMVLFVFITYHDIMQWISGKGGI